MRYTIAIPTHNDFDTIERCIDSVLNIDFDDYEIIVSDTSTDERTWLYLQEIKRKKNKRIRIYRNDSEWTMWDNHNFCFSNALGDYVLTIHTDDMLLDDCLKKIDRHLNKLSYPTKIILYGRSLYNDFTLLSECDSYKLESIIAGADAIKLFLKNGGLTPSGTLMSKNFINIGGYLYDAMVIPYSDCLSLINACFNGFSVYKMRDIVFIRSSNGTKLCEPTKNQIIEIRKYLDDYYGFDGLRIIIDLMFQCEGFALLKYLKNDDRFKRTILKRRVKYYLKHPFRFLNDKRCKMQIFIINVLFKKTNDSLQ